MWAYLVAMRDAGGEQSVSFGALVKARREHLGWNQDALAEEATLLMRRENPDSQGVSRTTISRWERGIGERYDADQVRAVFQALELDVREAVVLLGYAKREELDLPPEPPRIFDRTIEQLIDALNDPDLSDEVKQEIQAFVEFQTQRARTRQRPERERRAAG